MKCRKQFKPGQLITVNHIVYRCKNVHPNYKVCWGCDIGTDFYEGVIKIPQIRKICVKCRPDLHKIFKRV